MPPPPLQRRRQDIGAVFGAAVLCLRIRHMACGRLCKIEGGLHVDRMPGMRQRIDAGCPFHRVGLIAHHLLDQRDGNVDELHDTAGDRSDHQAGDRSHAARAHDHPFAV
jgi:hypothetical protein